MPRRNQAKLSPANLDRVQKLLDVANDSVTKQEFLDSFRAMVSQILDIEKQLVAKMNKNSQDSLNDLKRLRSEFEQSISAFKEDSHLTIGGVKRRAVETLEKVVAKQNLKGTLKKMEDKLESKLDKDESKFFMTGEDTEREIQRVVGDLKSTIPEPTEPDTGLEVISKINATDDDQEQIRAERVEGLEARLDALDKRTSSFTGGGGATSRDIIQDVDLSSQLDGSTKTFNLPAVWNVISVHTSSFPNALRKTIDFTYTSQTITFTDEVDAATTLAAGQTVVLTVVTG